MVKRLAFHHLFLYACLKLSLLLHSLLCRLLGDIREIYFFKKIALHAVRRKGD